MDFNELKNKRGAALQALQKELDETSNPKKANSKRWQDQRFWTPEVDKAGNGGALIRFLPAKDGNTPFVKVWSHGFRGPTGEWYIENSRTTIGDKDPVGELNNKLWNSGNEQQARDQKRKLQFISNILVIRDVANEKNNGKVFLFKYGKKIFEKIEQAAFPLFDAEGRPQDDENYDPVNAIDPFDMWEGANFRLLIRKYEGYRNYDLSKFEAKSKANEDELIMQKIFNELHDIQEFISPSNFKSYDELKTRLNRVLGIESVETAEYREPVTQETEVSSTDDDDEFDLQKLMEEAERG